MSPTEISDVFLNSFADLKEKMMKTEPPAPKRKYTRLTPKAWAEIEALWQVGEVTLAELSDRYEVSQRALQAHFHKHGITKGEKSAAIAAAVKEEVFKEELDDADLT